MPDCEKYMDLIGEQLDGELSQEQLAELHAHLEQCENCRRYRDALLAVENALAADLTPPPATLAKSVMARVNAMPAPGGVKAQKKPKLTLLRSVRSVTVAAMAVLVIWTGSRVISPKGSDKLALPEAAPAAMDMAAAESSMAYSVRAMGEENALADEAPMEMAPVITEAAPETEENIAYAAVDVGVAHVDIYRQGEWLMTTDEPGLWDFVQTRLLTASEPAERPEGEADYGLALFYPGGAVEQVSVWLNGEELCWQFDGGETTFRSPVAAEEFLRQFHLN